MIDRFMREKGYDYPTNVPIKDFIIEEHPTENSPTEDEAIFHPEGSILHVPNEKSSDELDLHEEYYAIARDDASLFQQSVCSVRTIKFRCFSRTDAY